MTRSSGTWLHATAAATLTVLAVITSAPEAVGKPLPCSYDEYPRMVCSFRMSSKSSGWIEFYRSGPCSHARRFDAYDRSKRVDLSAHAKWVGPGRMRFRAWGSPLGPLKVNGHWHGQRIDFINKSRFPVLIDFYIDCPY